MDAFIEINIIFNAKENEDKSHSWKLDELRRVLKTVKAETYVNGKRAGFIECIELLKATLPKQINENR